jgi:Flp pilus assembly protein TadD
MAAYGLTDDADDAFHRADMLAREALADDPQLWLGHMVLATTAVGRLRWGDAVAHADDAVRLAPEHPTALMSGALICIRAGEWEQATAMADKALRLNPGLPAYVHSLTAVGRLLADDDAGAFVAASLVHVEGMPWGPLYRALALAGLGRVDEGWREMREATRTHPEILEDPRAYLLSGFRFTDEQLATMLRHFEPFTRKGRHTPSSADPPLGDDDTLNG